MSQALNVPTLYDLGGLSDLAKEIAGTLKAGNVIALTGDLGAGKTTFTRFLCDHLNLTSLVSSPTYGYLNIYDDKVAHFDLYRLSSKEDFFSLGFEEYLSESFISIIEWPEIINQYLPSSTIHIKLSHKDGKREITIND